MNELNIFLIPYKGNTIYIHMHIFYSLIYIIIFVFVQFICSDFGVC